jgi:WD40 repeat protein
MNTTNRSRRLVVLWASFLVAGLTPLCAEPPSSREPAPGPAGAKVFTELLPPRGERGRILSVVFDTDGKKLLTVNDNGLAKLWDIATGKQIVATPAEGPALVSPDGTAFVVPSEYNREKVLCVLNPATGDVKRRIETPNDKVTCAAFSPDGVHLATGHEDGRIRVWEFATGRLVRALQFPSFNTPDSLAWSPDGRVLASTRREIDAGLLDIDNRIVLWNPLTGKRLRVFPGHAGPITTLSFSPDGKLLASSNSARGAAIRIREVASGEEVIRLPSSGGSPTPVAFSPDGLLLATGESHEWKRGEPVRVWATTDWKELARLPVPPGGVWCLAFSPDGSRLAVGKNDGAVPIWDVAALRAQAAPRARKLDTDELQDLWDRLTRRDGPNPYQAVNSLTAGGAASVTFLAGCVRPATAADPKWIAEQIEKLDNDDPKTRQAAFTALENVADEAEPTLREVSERPTNTAELRKRLDELLAIPGPVKSPEALRRVRTVQILERIGSDAARDLLRKLGEGNPKAPETLDARSALERLNSRDHRK